jgi:hypothetical protein
MKITNLINIAVNYWASFIEKNTSQNISITPDQINIFKDTLSRALINYWESTGINRVVLDVGQSPDDVLTEALSAAKIPLSALPSNTITFINFKHKTVKAKSGYRADLINLHRQQ